VRNLFDDLGTLAGAYDAVDWAATPMGAPSTWDQRLVDAVETMLATRFPVTLFWGPDLTMIYNQAFVPLIGDKHPAALGAAAEVVFPEAWPLIGPMLGSVVDVGTATGVETPTCRCCATASSRSATSRSPTPRCATPGAGCPVRWTSPPRPPSR
jgi:hypothetical protein